MPLARLMSKLSKRDSPNSRVASDMGAAEMDCDRSPSYALTTAVLKQQQAQRSRSLCSSSLSSASSAEAVLDMSSSMPADQHLRSHAAPPAANHSFMVGSLPSSSAAAAAAGDSNCTASRRVMRAKGKAALRGQTLGSDEQHSLDRSMSIEQQPGCAPFAVGSSGSAHSLPFQRAATDPVSLWVATGSITNSQKLPQLLAASGIIPADDEDDDEPLASPLSPGAAAGAEADPHCEWEDGVVAGWLDGIDPSELMHDEDELQQQPKKQQQQPQQHKQLQPMRSSSMSRAERSGSTASATMAAPEVVFGSLLYS